MITRLASILVATVVIALLAAVTRWLFFRRSSGYRRALVPVALAWLVGTPLGIWSESTEQMPPDWWRIVATYALPAILVGTVYWVRERRAQRAMQPVAPPGA